MTEEAQQDRIEKSVELKAPAVKGLESVDGLMRVRRVVPSEPLEGPVLLSAVAGLADADAVLLPAAQLHGQGVITTSAAGLSVLLALAANATTKSIIALTGGTRRFARRVVMSFVFMFGVGTAVWLFQATSVP